jgi:lauroyl/myristoyl acyltransferase
MSHELTKEIEHVLQLQHSARCLDDKEDFEAIMLTITAVIEEWISERCPGCR